MPPAELTPKQQWSELIRSARTILILPHTDPDGDALGSAIGLQLALEKLGKKVTVATQGNISENLRFLPAFDRLEQNFTIQKDLLVVIDETEAKVDNIALKRLSDTKLMLVITPKGGLITKSNVRLEEGTFDFDVVVVLDSANQDMLAPLTDDNPNLLYEVPVVNIDHHPGNTNFGKVNIVDLTASATAEIMVSLIETIGKDMPGIIDADIATCLLTGLIYDTSSFQNSNTTPKSLTVAAQLIAAGAHQQEIIKNLFKTRRLSTLRLWGRALSYIKEDTQLRFAWSSLTKADFTAAQASPDEASGVIDELMKSADGMDFVLLLSERGGDLHGSFRSVNPTVDVARLARLLGGGGHAQAAGFRIAKATIESEEEAIIGKIRDALTETSPLILPEE